MAQVRSETRDIRIPPIGLAGILHVPRDAYAIVAFVHGSGSSRLSPRNRAVADALNARGMATLLFDLLTYDEEIDRANVFDISLLADRLAGVVSWLDAQPSLARLPLGLFGASTGAAAALVAAAKFPRRVRAVVSRGGRPDLLVTSLMKCGPPPPCCGRSRHWRHRTQRGGVGTAAGFEGFGNHSGCQPSVSRTGSAGGGC